jgi:DNA end-binding protein Ku
MARPVWKGYLTVGLISIPVRLFAAARSKTSRFHLLHNKDLSRVHEVMYCSAEEKPLERSELVKGYEVAKNRYVVVADSELENVAPPTATSMEIVQFASSDEIDPIVFERSYYMAPDKNAEKPYNLLRAALSENRYCAIAKLSMHAREHIVVIRSVEDGLVLHTMYYADELNAASRVRSRAAEVNRKELSLATTLIQSLSAPFNIDEFHDQYRENIQRLIKQKQKGEEVTRAKQPRRAPVIDIMEALKKSIAANSPTQSKRRRSSKKRGAA